MPLCTKRRGAREGVREEHTGRDAGGTGKSPSEHLSLLSSLQAGKFPNFRHSFVFTALSSLLETLQGERNPHSQSSAYTGRAPACGFVLWGNQDAFSISPQKKTSLGTL